VHAPQRARPTTCFISAPTEANLGVLRGLLEARGLRVLVPTDLLIGSDWASQIKAQLKNSDLVIGVLTSERQSSWVLFELGQASALGRRIVLISPPDADPNRFALNQFLNLRLDLDNADAIGFALDQILVAPEATQRARRTPARLMGLGGKADEFLSSLDQLTPPTDWRSIELLLADALRSAGADVVATSPTGDTGEDVAVWSDVLEPFVGNPLLIELKLRLRDRSDARRAVGHLASSTETSGSRWAMLIYCDGPADTDELWSSIPTNILACSFRWLLEGLRTKSFPELVRDLRNRRVHGSSI
jgi:TIR domain